MTFSFSVSHRLFFVLAALGCLCLAPGAPVSAQAAPKEFVSCGIDIQLSYERIPTPVGGLQMRQASGKKRGATIVLNAGAALGANPAALATWQDAVAIWEALLDDDVTVTIDADLATLNPGVLGSTSSRVFVGDDYTEIRDPMVADAAAEEAFVTSLPTAAQFSMTIPPGFTTVNRPIATKANLRALGFDMSFDDPEPDARITFSSTFPFDFDPSDGISPGSWDFEAVAVHELGHALGFISRVDTNDFLRSQDPPEANEVRPTTLDLFRFLPGQGAADFTNNPRMLNTGDLAPTQVSYLGAVDLGMSTGVNLGDGRQTSHWKTDELTGTYLGIMDATIASGDRQVLTTNDIRALGVIGWDVLDCNDNAIGDATDIANETSQDSNTNNIPDECEGYAVTATNAASAPPVVSIYNVPDGSGRAFTEALQWDGIVGSSPLEVDATVTVEVVQTVGEAPLPGASVSLTSSLGGLVFCPEAGGTATNGSGLATFSGPLFAGGFTAAGEATLVDLGALGVSSLSYESGTGGSLSDLNIRFNSADLTGDGIVNLGDIGPFSEDLNGAYNYRSDFFYDGVLNLGDIGPFSAALGANCPASKDSGAMVAKGGRFESEIGIYFDRAGRSTSVNVAAGRVHEAYLLVRGAAARAGVAAWEAHVAVSSNVRVEEWILTESAMNFRVAPDFVVGMSGLRSANDALVVATVSFRVTDDQPATLAVRPSSLGSLGSQVPAVSVGRDYAVLPLGVDGATDGTVAWINDPSAPTDRHQIGSAKEIGLRNAPNPFNPRTEIQFRLPHEGRAEVEIFDLAGRLVRRLGGAVLAAGSHSLEWDGTDARSHGVGSGQYFYRLRVDGEVVGSTNRMSLVK